MTKTPNAYPSDGDRHDSEEQNDTIGGLSTPLRMHLEQERGGSNGTYGNEFHESMRRRPEDLWYERLIVAPDSNQSLMARIDSLIARSDRYGNCDRPTGKDTGESHANNEDPSANRTTRHDEQQDGKQAMLQSSDTIRYAKVIGTDVALAALAVILFSPGLIGLSPTDPSILLSSVAVASGVALAGAAVATNAKLLAPAPKQHLLEVGSLGNDADSEPSLDEVQGILDECRHLPTVGMFASDGFRQVEETERKHQRIVAMIDRKFPKGSLSWQRFSSTLDSVISTIVRNSALIANQVQSFDDDGYQNNRMVVDSGDYRYDNVPDDIQLGRYKLYEDILSSMRSILNDNERLLLELDRFELEMAILDSSNLSEDSETMLDELKKAVSEMQYYAH